MGGFADGCRQILVSCKTLGKTESESEPVPVEPSCALYIPVSGGVT